MKGDVVIKFAEFGEKNKPATVTVSLPELEALIECLGFKIEPSHKEGWKTVRNGRLKLDLMVEAEFKLIYSGGMQFDDRMEYKASVLDVTHRGERDIYNTLNKALLERFAPPITVPFPEPVVKLPTPSWVWACADEDRNPWIEADKMFESEARVALASFNEEANACFGR